MVLLSNSFFDEYPNMFGYTHYIPEVGISNVVTLWNFLWRLLVFVWVLLLIFTIISLIIAVVRLAISSDDIPQLKARAKHDLAASLVMLAIMGGIPALFALIVGLLNMGY